MHKNIKRTKMLLMRTTIDIPDHLLRRAKAEASLRGIPFKEYIASVIRRALRAESGPGSVAETAPPYAGEERQVLGEGCVFPLIRGEGGPALRDLTPERIHEILEEEDIERALGGREPSR